jgi:hypothetical protein
MEGLRIDWGTRKAAAFTFAAVTGVCLALRLLSPVWSILVGLIASQAVSWTVWIRHMIRSRRVFATRTERENANDFIEALDFDWDPGIRRFAKDQLCILLPQLTVADAVRLNTRHRTLLNDALNEHERLELVLAILEALPRIGDESSLPIIERLARVHSASAGQEVSNSATTCLTLLRKRLDAESDQYQLLRPSDHIQFQRQSLVRPASRSESASDDQLLRPGNIDDSEK